MKRWDLFLPSQAARFSTPLSHSDCTRQRSCVIRYARLILIPFLYLRKTLSLWACLRFLRHFLRVYNNNSVYYLAFFFSTFIGGFGHLLILIFRFCFLKIRFWCVKVIDSLDRKNRLVILFFFSSVGSNFLVSRLVIFQNINSVMIFP